MVVPDRMRLRKKKSLFWYFDRLKQLSLEQSSAGEVFAQRWELKDC